ncbi:MAG: aldehyde dehydrogenase iron-sulfur subunit [Polaromonas sp.]|nr:aldehyde dehydrogenase iron-sulfur subunit [Polaromonas sp.]
MDENNAAQSPAWRPTRRAVLQTTAIAAAAPVAFEATAQGSPAAALDTPGRQADGAPSVLTTRLTVNGKAYELRADARTTLLDALREHLQLTGSKKGCDHGQCGACTVLLEGRRINACLTLVAMHDGQSVTTIEGLARGDELHPLQAAFVKHDGFQCGYCTPGQICSAAGMLAEVRLGMPSHATADLRAPVRLSDEEIRERMSGNICRCSAYPNIVAAIRDASETAA